MVSNLDARVAEQYRSRRTIHSASFFGVGYRLAFGPQLRLVSGAVHGITIGWEYFPSFETQTEILILV
jgi:hypothetical protein